MKKSNRLRNDAGSHRLTVSESWRCSLCSLDWSRFTFSCLPNDHVHSVFYSGGAHGPTAAAKSAAGAHQEPGSSLRHIMDQHERDRALCNCTFVVCTMKTSGTKLLAPTPASTWWTNYCEWQFGLLVSHGKQRRSSDVESSQLPSRCKWSHIQASRRTLTESQQCLF